MFLLCWYNGNKQACRLISIHQSGMLCGRAHVYHFSFCSDWCRSATWIAPRASLLGKHLPRNPWMSSGKEKWCKSCLVLKRASNQDFRHEEGKIARLLLVLAESALYKCLTGEKEVGQDEEAQNWLATKIGLSLHQKCHGLGQLHTVEQSDKTLWEECSMHPGG